MLTLTTSLMTVAKCVVMLHQRDDTAPVSLQLLADELRRLVREEGYVLYPETIDENPRECISLMDDLRNLRRFHWIKFNEDLGEMQPTILAALFTRPFAFPHEAHTSKS